MKKKFSILPIRNDNLDENEKIVLFHFRFSADKERSKAGFLVFSS